MYCNVSAQRFTENWWWHVRLDSGIMDDPSFSGDCLGDRFLDDLLDLWFVNFAGGGVLEEDDDHDWKID